MTHSSRECFIHNALSLSILFLLVFSRACSSETRTPNVLWVSKKQKSVRTFRQECIYFEIKETLSDSFIELMNPWPGVVLCVKIVRHLYWQGQLIFISLIEAGQLTNSPNFFSQSTSYIVRTKKRYLFGELMNAGLVLGVKIVRPMYWQGRLLVISLNQTPELVID